MPWNNNDPLRAVFDVRPVTKNGALDVEKINSIQPVINLAVSKTNDISKDIDWDNKETEQDVKLKVESFKTKASVVAQDPEVFPRLAVKEEFEKYLSTADASLILSLGGHIHGPAVSKPRIKPIISKKKTVVDIDSIAKKIHEKDFSLVNIVEEKNEEPVIEGPIISDQPKGEIDLLVAKFHSSPPPKALFKKKSGFKFNTKKVIGLGMALIAFVGASYVFGSNLKEKATKDGESAVASLESAGDDIKNLDFVSAGNNFSSAYEQFSKTGEDINFLGASIGSILESIPGAGKLKSANSLVGIGKLFADTGASMAKAMESLSGASAIFGGEGQSSRFVFASMTDALAVARKNIEQASKLADSIDLESIPEDKRNEFKLALESLPLFKETVNKAFDYSKFLERLAGVYGSKKYLILFQNQTELRPTGGFPGTYGLVTFQNGSVKEFKVDDIYNIDGQLKENIVPPKQLQHIVPNWAMRDANWFLDFPTSARKVMEFYKKESGLDVDGVIVINPEVVSDVIKILGPIELKEYNLVLNEENFVSELQEEVEYGKNRTQPKTVMLAFANELLNKVKSADSSLWPQIFSALSAGTEKKNTLMYFKDLYLERFAIDNNFGGEIKETDSDYLMVSFSNIKGSKTDRFTDTSLDLNSELKDGNVIHTLTISRKHNGGDHELGFYNKINPAFVRILVPEGSQLISISGQDNPSYQPLVNYSSNKFSRDSDLEKLEKSFINNPEGWSQYSESGKTGFAFWMVTNPKSTKTVTISYTVPQKYVQKDYSLYIQKQPGLKISNFNYSLFSSQAFNIVSSIPKLSAVLGKHSLNMALEKDLPISIKFE